MSKSFEDFKKAELVKVWKQLDGADEAISKLELSGFDIGDFDLTQLNYFKELVEMEIQKKSRKPHEFK